MILTTVVASVLGRTGQDELRPRVGYLVIGVRILVEPAFEVAVLNPAERSAPAFGHRQRHRDRLRVVRGIRIRDGDRGVVRVRRKTLGRVIHRNRVDLARARPVIRVHAEPSYVVRDGVVERARADVLDGERVRIRAAALLRRGAQRWRRTGDGWAGRAADLLDRHVIDHGTPRLPAGRLRALEPYRDLRAGRRERDRIVIPPVRFAGFRVNQINRPNNRPGIRIRRLAGQVVADAIADVGIHAVRLVLHPLVQSVLLARRDRDGLTNAARPSARILAELLRIHAVPGVGGMVPVVVPAALVDHRLVRDFPAVPLCRVRPDQEDAHADRPRIILFGQAFERVQVVANLPRLEVRVCVAFLPRIERRALGVDDRRHAVAVLVVEVLYHAPPQREPRHLRPDHELIVDPPVGVVARVIRDGHAIHHLLDQDVLDRRRIAHGDVERARLEPQLVTSLGKGLFEPPDFAHVFHIIHVRLVESLPRAEAPALVDVLGVAVVRVHTAVVLRVGQVRANQMVDVQPADDDRVGQCSAQTRRVAEGQVRQQDCLRIEPDSLVEPVGAGVDS